MTCALRGGVGAKQAEGEQGVEDARSLRHAGVAAHDLQGARRLREVPPPRPLACTVGLVCCTCVPCAKGQYGRQTLSAKGQRVLDDLLKPQRGGGGRRTY